MIRWLLGPLLALLIGLLPLEGLSPEAHRLAGLMAWVICWWMLEPVPLPATALIAAALAMVLGIGKPAQVLAPFADPVIFLFMGGFFIARAMELHGTDRWMALRVLRQRAVRGRPWRTIAALILITTFISMWISNTATTVIMLPIALGVTARLFPNADEMKAQRGWVILAIACGASIGGVATPVGSPPNAVAVGMLDRIAGARIGFLEWMSIGVPVALALTAVLLGVVHRRLHPLPPKMDTSFLDEEARMFGPLTRAQRNTLLVGIVAITLWLLPDSMALILGRSSALPAFLHERFSEAATALFASALLFVLPAGNGKPTLTWADAQRIDWGTLLLFGGGLSLGTLMFETGLSATIGKVLPAAGENGELSLIFLASLVLMTVIWTEVASNTATANMLIPMVIASAQSASVNPVAPTLATGLACSLAFMMPVGTPPNAIAYGTGLVSMRMMNRNGLVLNIASVFVIWIAAWIAS